MQCIVVRITFNSDSNHKTLCQQEVIINISLQKHVFIQTSRQPKLHKQTIKFSKLHNFGRGNLSWNLEEHPANSV